MKAALPYLERSKMMMSSRTSPLADTSLTQRISRYSVVSVVSTVLGLTLLYAFNQGVGLSATIANVLAALIGSPPIYLLYRNWAWKGVRVERERDAIAQYVLATGAAVIVSTFVVFVADAIWGDGLVSVVASLAGYGLVWVLRFALFDTVVFQQ